MRVAAIDKNGTFFDTATNVPIDVSVKTRRNQAAVNTVTFPKAGKLGYACGMDMAKGIIVVE